MDAADRLHQVLVSVAEALATVLEGAQFERGDGHCFMAFPTFPIRDVNGVWADTDAAADELATRRAQACELRVPFAVMTRAGKSPAVEQAARKLGLTDEIRIPGMTVTGQDLSDPPSDLEVLRVKTAEGLAQALAVGASGFGVPADLVASVYSLEVAHWTDSRRISAVSTGVTSRLRSVSRSTGRAESSAWQHRKNIAAMATARRSPRRPCAMLSRPAPT
jgi:hypothetical protein